MPPAPGPEAGVSMANYTNYCCRSGGNNLNAGTVDGSTTEPATTPLVTYAAGDWNSGTGVYTAPVGANMTEAVVGRSASVYHDGDTIPVSNQYTVGRISAVNAGTRQVTIHSTARATFGTGASTGTGNRSMRIGGAWAGPSGTAGFPFTVGLAAATNVSLHPVRVNYKNDAVYAITAAITAASNFGGFTHQGYTSAYGDFGRAVLDGGSSGAAYTMLTLPATVVTMADWEIRNNGASGGSAVYGLYFWFASGFKGYRITAHNLRGPGIAVNSNWGWLTECEAYLCNQSNTASQGGFQITSGSNVILERCMAHDNAGSNTSGVHSASGACLLVFDKCVFDTNGLHGANFSSAPNVKFKNCDFYNNVGSGANLSGGAQFDFENCNFVKNGAYGYVVGANTITTEYNCGFGSGTMVNVSGDTSGIVAESVGKVTYAADVTPWTDPANGDFRISLAAAKGTGRGSFLQIQSGHAGTIAYPDIGAAQSTGGGSLVPSEILVKSGTQIRFCVSGSLAATAANNWSDGSPTNVALTLANLANGAARQSAKADLGSLRANRFSLFSTIDLGGKDPSIGGYVHYYWAPSTSVTTATGNTAGNNGTDAVCPAGALGGITMAEFLRWCIHIGSIRIHDGSAVQNMFVGWLKNPPSRYGQLIVVNGAGDLFKGDDVQAHHILMPDIDEMQ